MYSFNTHESFSVIFKLSQHIESRKQYTKYQYVDYESICIKNMHTYRRKYSVLILPRWMRLWVFNFLIFLIPFSKIRMLLLLLSRFSRVRLCATHRQQPTRLPVPGILQARKLEWVAISFSNAWKWKVKVKSLSRIWLSVTPWTAAHQAPPSMGLSR